VKHLKTVFNALKWAYMGCFLAYLTPVQAAEEVNVQCMDSVEISLLTCQPHDEIYSLYGHTAIRYHELWQGGLDAAFNYGVFNYRAPHFVLRFIFGLTDYELGAYPYSLFQGEYRHFGSMVTEQVLNLTNEEKMRLRLALAENLLPENTVYRYNYFYNNCTTKARDVIEQCVNGRIEYKKKDNSPSYRDMVHEMTKDNPWTQAGNDLLLGIKADQKTDYRQQECLPHNLMNDFDSAVIIANGECRSLVKERRTAVPAGVGITQKGFPLSPLTCGGILLLLSVAIAFMEHQKKRVFRIWDGLLMFVTGAIGLILFLMLFSQHPTVSLNLQLIFFNPIHWLFLWPVVRGKKTRYWQIASILGLLFIIGGFFQCYASGIVCLALCLLVQCGIHYELDKK